jgi:NhaA family Na+:H+ antiporter
VLPLFALANAGVALSMDTIGGHQLLMLAVVIGLVVGKPLGFLLFCGAAVMAGVATKPNEYSWAQLGAAGVLAGIGFTMSLFIAGQAFPVEADFEAAKIAVLTASVLASILGVLALWAAGRGSSARAEDIARGGARGSAL